MMYYVPRPFHAAIAAFVCILLIALGARAQGRVLMALSIGAFMFAVMTAVILWMLIIRAYDDHWETIARFAEVYGKLDEESRAALGLHFPTMRYTMKRGEVRAKFENTEATIEHFRLFLQTSDDRQISPERDWTGGDSPRWAWQEIKGWLEDHDYIVEGSAAGSHSWLWSGNSYRHLMAYWTAGRNIRDLNKDVAYAYETEQV